MVLKSLLLIFKVQIHIVRRPHIWKKYPTFLNKSKLVCNVKTKRYIFYSDLSGLLRIFELYYVLMRECIVVCRINLWKWWMSKHTLFIQDVSSVFTKAIGSFGKRINSIKGICRTDWIRYLINKLACFSKKLCCQKD